MSRLASELKGRGLDVWWDAKIKPGQRWDEALRRAIDEADACLVLVSEASDPSEPWLSREWSTIQERSWAKPDLRIYPVQLGDANVPPFLRKWRALRLSKAAGETGTAADRIVALLRYPPPASEADRAREQAARTARFAELERMITALKAMEGDERPDGRDG